MKAKDQSRTILFLRIRLEIVVASQSNLCTSMLINMDRWELLECERQIFGWLSALAS